MAHDVKTAMYTVDSSHVTFGSDSCTIQKDTRPNIKQICVINNASERGIAFPHGDNQGERSMFSSSKTRSPTRIAPTSTSSLDMLTMYIHLSVC